MEAKADLIPTALAIRIPFGIQNRLYIKPEGNIGNIFPSPLFPFSFIKGKIATINLGH